MQQFYRPDGDSTQKRGVLADIELPSLTTHLDVGEADLDYPVEFDKVEPLQYKHFDYVNPAVCDQLRQLSQQRVQASEKFQKVVRNIARYKEQKAKKYVTLNEEKFLKERAELNADKEEEKAIEKHSDLNSGTIERDFYLDEVLAIATDYLNLEHVAKVQTRGQGDRGSRGEAALRECIVGRDSPSSVAGWLQPTTTTPVHVDLIGPFQCGSRQRGPPFASAIGRTGRHFVPSDGLYPRWATAMSAAWFGHPGHTVGNDVPRCSPTRFDVPLGGRLLGGEKRCRLRSLGSRAEP